MQHLARLSRVLASTPIGSSTVVISTRLNPHPIVRLTGQVVVSRHSTSDSSLLRPRGFAMSSSAIEGQPDGATASASADVPEPQTAPSCPPEKGTGSTETAAVGSASAPESEPKRPPLTPQEFRTYNHLAEKMDYFHEHFRRSWNLLYTAASTGKRPGGMTLKQFINEGISLVSYLETHHGIEESYLFPLLARKMPEFRSGKGGGGAAELLRQHQLIHAGMEGFEKYLRQCRNRETELELSVMKEKMDTWGEVLMKHLDQEVKTLGAENMRNYWTLEEVRGFPI